MRDSDDPRPPARAATPIAILSLLVLFEAALFFGYPDRTELSALGASLAALRPNAIPSLTQPRSGEDRPVAAFAASVDNVLPATARVLYADGSADFANARNYYELNLYLHRSRRNEVLAESPLSRARVLEFMAAEALDTVVVYRDPELVRVLVGTPGSGSAILRLKAGRFEPTEVSP